jgi:hypothetical protein
MPQVAIQNYSGVTSAFLKKSHKAVGLPGSFYLQAKKKRRSIHRSVNSLPSLPVMQWYRSFGNELWEFGENGLMRKRFASINDLPIKEKDRNLR